MAKILGELIVSFTVSDEDMVGIALSKLWHIPWLIRLYISTVTQYEDNIYLCSVFHLFDWTFKLIDT